MSLNKHAMDISKDKRLIETVVLCLTETHHPRQNKAIHNKAKIMNSPFKLLLSYRKNTENLNLFYGNLAEINTYQTLDILGDYSINALEPDS